MIVAISASGRVNSNSAALMEEALKPFPKAEITKIDLSRLAFRGCIGCVACRSGAGKCIMDDELIPVLDAVRKADIVILAAPVYYGHVSGIFKSFIDRWYSFRDKERNLRMKEGRRLLFIIAQGHPDPEAYEAPLRQMEKIFSGYGFKPHFLVAAGLEKPAMAKKDPALLQRAHEMGKHLIDGK